MEKAQVQRTGRSRAKADNMFHLIEMSERGPTRGDSQCTDLILRYCYPVRTSMKQEPFTKTPNTKID